MVFKNLTTIHHILLCTFKIIYELKYGNERWGGIGKAKGSSVHCKGLQSTFQIKSISWHAPQTLPSLETQKTANRAHCHQWDEKPGLRRTKHSGSSPFGTSCLEAFQAGCYDIASAAFQNGHKILQTALLHGATQRVDNCGTGQSLHVWETKRTIQPRASNYTIV